MTELYFLRHGQRIDHALRSSSDAKPILENYKPFDPPLSTHGADQMRLCGQSIANLTTLFNQDAQQNGVMRKNIFIHFSPFLRCCQLADILATELKRAFTEKFPHYKLRLQLLGDFALSEWVHDKMPEKPPYNDSDEAYEMYTPNIKSLHNHLACSNFRPTATLGQYNGQNLSYKDYLNRCKEYFTKLLATYDRSIFIKNDDIIIVVAHGYNINKFLLYFVSHPIFEEIPEAVPNMAVRELKNYRKQNADGDENIEDDESEQDDSYKDACSYIWELRKDCLGLATPNHYFPLNLESDIVYYKTNFIKKNELHEITNTLRCHVPPPLERARPSFKITNYIESNYNGSQSRPLTRLNNPICPAAKEWSPQKSAQFKIRSEFKLKVMNDDVFRKTFDLTRRPAKPVTPDVSPNSEPTRSNSVIDLAKLNSNEDILRPMKLRYLSASEISIHRLNSKVNSQVNLLKGNLTNNSSLSDLSRQSSQLQSRQPAGANRQDWLEDHSGFPFSPFPTFNITSPVNSAPNTAHGYDSHHRHAEPINPELVKSNGLYPIRSQSPHYSRTASQSLLSRYRLAPADSRVTGREEEQEQENEDKKWTVSRPLALAFGEKDLKIAGEYKGLLKIAENNSEDTRPRPFLARGGSSTPMFYQLGASNNPHADQSDTSDESDMDPRSFEQYPDGKENSALESGAKYMWFGANRDE